MFPISSLCKNITCLSQSCIQDNLNDFKVYPGWNETDYCISNGLFSFSKHDLPHFVNASEHLQLSSLLQLLGEIKYIIMSRGVVNYLSPYVKFKLIFQGRGGIVMSQTQVSDVSLRWSVVVQGESTTEKRFMRRRFKLGPWHLAEEITGLACSTSKQHILAWVGETSKGKRHLFPQYTFKISTP